MPGRERKRVAFTLAEPTVAKLEESSGECMGLPLSRIVDKIVYHINTEDMIKEINGSLDVIQYRTYIEI